LVTSPDPSVREIALRSVTVKFGNVVALDDATFTAEAACITGLVGRNGAGKSTSIHVLAGFVTPDRGDASLLGEAVDRRDGAPASVKRQTGFLLSDPALFPYLSPTETLLFLGEVYGLDARESSARTAKLLRFFELESAQDRLVDGFSTGMLKRMALAAALIHSPRALILDEPFEGLDPLMVRRLKTLLLQYRATGGTVLVSSHLIHVIAEICDHVCFLDRGKVIYDGAIEAAPDGDSGGKLEELYAGLVEESDPATLEWLRVS